MTMAKPKPSQTPLTPKQQRFVQEYLQDHNGTQAAIRAGYSEKTAKQQGSRLLTDALKAQVLSDADLDKRVQERGDLVAKAQGCARR